ncbi:MAG: hypothetical protein H7Z42_21945 [Roseiflexaceae bacterium]|nr:hypothetical protein [Roseiflexaceae bacterium]
MATTHQVLPAISARARTGGPRRPSKLQFERAENNRAMVVAGTHMPLDTDIHWNWRNPLIILPMALLALLLYAIIGTVVSLL